MEHSDSFLVFQLSMNSTYLFDQLLISLECGKIHINIQTQEHKQIEEKKINKPYKYILLNSEMLQVLNTFRCENIFKDFTFTLKKGKGMTSISSNTLFQVENQKK